jgi:Glycosyltransferase 61
MKRAKALRRVRETVAVDALIHRHGPAVHRVPRALRRRAVGQSSIPEIAGVRTWRFGEREVLSPRPPRTLDGEVSLSRLALREHRLPTPFVAEIPGAWLVGRHAVPFTTDGQMLLTCFRDAVGMLAAEPHPDLERWVGGDRDGVETPEDLVSALRSRPACSLVGRLDSNYFHWLIDACGQLEGVHVYREQTGVEPMIVVRSGAPRFVRESLAILGLDSGSVLEWPLRWSSDMPLDDRLVAVPVPTLVVSAWRGYGHGCSGKSLNWLREAFRRCALGDGVRTRADGARYGRGELIYIQRPRRMWRTIENENAVRRCLEERGFQTVRPGEHSLSDQISLFSRASIIVGMHGAGLTNILFAPDAELVELVGSYGGSEYFSMCRGLVNRYTRVQCEDRGEDVYVDLGLLRSALGEAADR